MQKYKDEYSKQYSCIVKSSKSDEQAFCMIWSADISVSHILPYFGALSPFFKTLQVGISVVKLCLLIYKAVNGLTCMNYMLPTATLDMYASQSVVHDGLLVPWTIWHSV